MNENKTIEQLNAKGGGFYYASTIAIYVMLSFLGQALMSALAEKTSVVYLAVCSTFSTLSFVLIMTYVLAFVKVKPTKLLGESKGVAFLPISLLLSCGMFLGLGYVNDAIASIFIGWGFNVGGLSVPLDTIGQYLLFVVVLAILPAISEELFFRGLILNSLSGAKKIYAVLVSALCFSLYHGSVAQLVYQFIYGVALGCLFLCAKSIIPCIVAHFLNNFAILTFTFFGVNVDLYNPLLIVIGVVCLACFSTLTYFRLRKRKNDKQIVKGELKSFFFPFAIFGIIVCLSLAIGGMVG